MSEKHRYSVTNCFDFQNNRPIEMQVEAISIYFISIPYVSVFRLCFYFSVIISLSIETDSYSHARINPFAKKCTYYRINMNEVNTSEQHIFLQHPYVRSTSTNKQPKRANNAHINTIVLIDGKRMNGICIT